MTNLKLSVIVFAEFWSGHILSFSFFDLGGLRWSVSYSNRAFNCYAIRSIIYLYRRFSLLSVICDSGVPPFNTTQAALIMKAGSSGRELYDRLWSQTRTVPAWLLLILFPLISIRSPAFLGKFTSLGKIILHSARKDSHYFCLV